MFFPYSVESQEGLKRSLLQHWQLLLVSLRVESQEGLKRDYPHIAVATCEEAYVESQEGLKHVACLTASRYEHLSIG